MRTTRKPLATAIFMLLSSAGVQAAESQPPAPTPSPPAASNDQTSTPTTLRKVTVGATATKDFGAAATTVGGKGSTLIRDVPQSVTVLNRAVLDAQGATTLTE